MRCAALTFFHTAGTASAAHLPRKRLEGHAAEQDEAGEQVAVKQLLRMAPQLGESRASDGERRDGRVQHGLRSLALTCADRAGPCHWRAAGRLLLVTKFSVPPTCARSGGGSIGSSAA